MSVCQHSDILCHSLPALCSIHSLGQTVLLQLQPRPGFPLKISRFIFVKSICRSYSPIIDNVWLATRIFLVIYFISMLHIFRSQFSDSHLGSDSLSLCVKVHCMFSCVLQLYFHLNIKDSYRIRHHGCLQLRLKIVNNLYFICEILTSPSDTTCVDQVDPRLQLILVLLVLRNLHLYSCFFQNALESSKSTLQSLYSCQLCQKLWCL